jgi:TRAP-type C4-dicarboxylate transport system permease small subunit
VSLDGTAVVVGARPLLRLVDAAAAALLAADLGVVAISVVFRYVLAALLEWSDDVARGLLVALAFFGAAAALARGESIGITVLRDRLPPASRRLADAIVAVLVLITVLAVTVNAGNLGYVTGGQTTGSGLPLEWTFYPMAAGAACMSLFALDAFRRRDARTAIAAVGVVTLIAGAGAAWIAFAPDRLPTPAGRC